MKNNASKLQSRRIETSQKGVFYDVPHNGRRKKATSIPASYLKQRVEYGIDQLRKRVKIATGKHLSIHREGAYRSISELRDQIMEAIETHAKDGLNSQSEHAKFCKDLDIAIDSFKSENKDTLHVTQRFAEMYLRIEREAISKIFELPNGQTDAINSPEKDEMQKLSESSTKLIEENADTPQKTRLIREQLKEANRGLNQLVDLHQEFLKRQKVIGQIEGLSKDSLEQMAHIEAAQGYFRALISYKGRMDLKGSASKLEQQTSELAKTRKNLEKLYSLTAELKEVQAQISTLNSKIGLTPEKEGVSSDGNEEIAAKNDEASEQNDVPQAMPSQHELKTFRWNKASMEEATSEARLRLVSFNPLIAFLAETERWHDLRLVFDKMNTADLRASKLSQCCIGHKDARFPKKSDLFEACFPKSYENPEFTNLPGEIERGRQAKRFRWNKEGIDFEEIQAEVRRRIFEAWPLLCELYDEQMWIELRYMIERMNGVMLSECRITIAAYSQKKSPYNSYEEMLKDSFAEAFKD